MGFQVAFESQNVFAQSNVSKQRVPRGWSSNRKSATGQAATVADMLWGSVNSDRPSQLEMAIFDPIHNRNPTPDCNTFPARESLNQIWYKSIHWGLLGKRMNCFCAFFINVCYVV